MNLKLIFLTCRSDLVNFNSGFNFPDLKIVEIIFNITTHLWKYSLLSLGVNIYRGQKFHFIYKYKYVYK